MPEGGSMHWMMSSFSITDALVAIIAGDQVLSALLLDCTIRVNHRQAAYSARSSAGRITPDPPRGIRTVVRINLI